MIVHHIKETLRDLKKKLKGQIENNNNNGEIQAQILSSGGRKIKVVVYPFINLFIQLSIYALIH